MSTYIADEQKRAAAADEFAQAFDSVKNAEIHKSQKNSFGLYAKYPIILLITFAVLAADYVCMFTMSMFDALFIVCTVVITLAAIAITAIVTVTWRRVIQNARLAEKITYYDGEEKCMVTEITGGGYKVEWKDASLYRKGDEFELIESKTKEYRSTFYKKIHGHSRGFRLLDADNIVNNFFGNATVVSSTDGETELSNGFKYKIEFGQLKYFEITGFYDECYENNFPLWAAWSQSKSYTFRYEFTAVNTPNFRLITPERTKECAGLFFVTLPKDKNIIIH